MKSRENKSDQEWLEDKTADGFVSDFNQLRKSLGMKAGQLKFLVLLEQDLLLASYIARYYDLFVNPKTCSFSGIYIVEPETSTKYGDGVLFEGELADFAWTNMETMTSYGGNRPWTSKVAIVDQLADGPHTIVLPWKIVDTRGQVVDFPKR